MNKSDFRKDSYAYVRIIPRSNAWRTRFKPNDTTLSVPAERQILEVKVVSVGRKYISVEIDGAYWRRARFNIENNFTQDDDGEYNYILFSSREDAERSILRDNLYQEIRTRYFSNITKTELPLETLQEIWALLAASQIAGADRESEKQEEKV